MTAEVRQSTAGSYYAAQTGQLLGVVKKDNPHPLPANPLARWSWSREKSSWRFQQLHFQGRPSYCRLWLGGSRSLRQKLRSMVKHGEKNDGQPMDGCKVLCLRLRWPCCKLERGHFTENEGFDLLGKLICLTELCTRLVKEFWCHWRSAVAYIVEEKKRWSWLGVELYVLSCPVIVSCMASGVMFFPFLSLSCHYYPCITDLSAPLVIVIDIIRMNSSISILIELH